MMHAFGRVALAAGSLLLAPATAQLLVNPLWRNHGADSSLHEASSPLSHEGGAQQPLGGKSSTGKGLPPYKAGQFKLTPQSNETCATYGEDQWTGTIDVTDERRLFFWYFDSRNDPDNDPIIVWLNGGPGGSSMMGLFNEMGPCWLEPDTTETVPNDFSWNNNASVLFLDQPAGVGFSSRAEGAAVPRTDMDGAQDFQTFLNIFFRDVFPSKAHLPIHIAAESYGGHYGPTYVNHIVQSRAYDSPSAFRGNIASMILVNAVVDFTGPPVGAYDLLCSDFRGGDIVSPEACEAIRQSVPECEQLGRSCALSYDPYECLAMVDYCQNAIDSWYYELVALGLRNPYNINLGCPALPLCDDVRKGNFQDYLNQDHVKEALGFPASFNYSRVSWDINTAYEASRVVFKPTTHEVASILDAHAHPALSSDIRVLVLNGNEDYIVNTPGNVWVYERLLWSGLPDYRIAKWEPLPGDVAAEGFWKGTRDGRLVFVGVDGAGHTVPGDVRQGSWEIALRWMQGGWRA